MKQKLLIAGLCACLMALVTGCGNKDEAATEPTPGASAGAIPPEAQQAQSQAQEAARADAAARSAHAAGAPGTSH